MPREAQRQQAVAQLPGAQLERQGSQAFPLEERQPQDALAVRERLEQPLPEWWERLVVALALPPVAAPRPVWLRSEEGQPDAREAARPLPSAA